MKKIKDLSLLRILEEIEREEGQYLIEGIDIDYVNKVVSFNPNHEDAVNTSTILNPTMEKINGNNVYSIFKRNTNNGKGDGNPLISALKGLHNWKLKNGFTDILNLLRQFNKITEKFEKLSDKYDTIIMIPSNNPLNKHILYNLNKIIDSDYEITDYLYKMSAEDVFETIKWEEMYRDYGNDYKIVEKQMKDFFDNMEDNNDGVFSYKMIETYDLRKYVGESIKGNTNKVLNYAPYINNKNILILDDTISSGASISNSCKIILDSFTPKNTTVITLFSRK